MLSGSRTPSPVLQSTTTPRFDLLVLAKTVTRECVCLVFLGERSRRQHACVDGDRGGSSAGAAAATAEDCGNHVGFQQVQIAVMMCVGEKKEEDAKGLHGAGRVVMSCKRHVWGLGSPVYMEEEGETDVTHKRDCPEKGGKIQQHVGESSLVVGFVPSSDVVWVIHSFSEALEPQVSLSTTNHKVFGQPVQLIASPHTNPKLIWGSTRSQGDTGEKGERKTTQEPAV
ncbi:hypothetical protein Taro_020114 [Colocasia esculenta]|uniref:Uncharacterized protein n=1 Tax=Colocasia esculenta TaxID=4460 RepID=A0A843V157_COLES|nr:hypothetical protein [Colocasia esculenta]